MSKKRKRKKPPLAFSINSTSFINHSYGCRSNQAKENSQKELQFQYNALHDIIMD